LDVPLNIFKILGTCFLFAGWGKHLLTFNKDVTAMTASLMVVASASLVVPLAISFGSAGTQPEQDDGILLVSRTTSIVLLILYGVYLWFQTMTHARLFQSGEEDEEECHKLGLWTAVVVLILATLGVTVCSDRLVDSIDGFVKSAHVGRPFIGMIIVAIVGNIGEYFTTVNVAMKGKLDLAIALVVGSTLQIALFVTPFLVILGWILGQPMTLKFGMFETTVFTLSVLVVNYLIQDGRTNYFAGALLIGT
jgi:calcium/proton exchanger